MKNTYLHRVQYYETDKMGIVHHSNYIRWFEEARTDLLEKDGFGYDGMEERGIMIPVLSVSCEYKVPVRFGQTVAIECEKSFFDGVRFGISYRVLGGNSEKDGKQILHVTGETRHCFLSDSFKIINIRRYAPDIYAYFKEGSAH